MKDDKLKPNETDDTDFMEQIWMESIAERAKERGISVEEMTKIAKGKFKISIDTKIGTLDNYKNPN